MYALWYAESSKRVRVLESLETNTYNLTDDYIYVSRALLLFLLFCCSACVPTFVVAICVCRYLPCTIIQVALWSTQTGYSYSTSFDVPSTSTCHLHGVMTDENNVSGRDVT